VGLREYLLVLRTRWVVVVTCALIALTVAGLSTFRAPRIYQAQASIFFSVSIGQQSRDLSSGFSYAQGLVGAYAQVAGQPLVLKPVIAQLGLNVTPKALAGAISTSVPLDTVIINLTVSDRSPTRAKEIADAVAQQLAVTVGELVPGVANKSAPVRVTVVAPAAEPDKPSSPRVGLGLTLGLLGGLLLGIVLAFVRDALDARINSRRDVERVTDAPVIGTISLPSTGLSRRRLFSGRRSLVEDRARELRTNFQHVRVARQSRSVVFTSAHEDRATALTVASLGVELAHAGMRTLMVDGDLRKPSLAAWFGVEETRGLSTVLQGEAQWWEVIQHRPPRLFSVLPAGPPLTDPAALMRSSTIAELMAEFAEHYDVVLIKSPPVLRVADGLLFCRIADGTVVVADEPRMESDDLSEELHALEVADATVLGIVLMT
jgi:succinoglycan biosynthesis transport protein ExoP